MRILEGVITMSSAHPNVYGFPNSIEAQTELRC